MKICRVRKCNVERPVLPYFSSKLFELQVPFLNFLNLFGVLDPCDCGFPKLGPKTSMIFADTREFTRSTRHLTVAGALNRYGLEPKGYGLHEFAFTEESKFLRKCFFAKQIQHSKGEGVISKKKISEVSQPQYIINACNFLPTKGLKVCFFLHFTSK